MAHFPKPFYRPSRGVWYVQIAGKQENLGPDKGAAFREYHALMAQPATVTAAAPPARASASAEESDPLVVTVIDAFLDWCQKNRAPRTYDWYKDRAQSFVNSISPDLTVVALRVFHVQQWVDAHDTWNQGMKRGCMLAVQRALNWAVEQGHVNASPLAKMKKPPAGKRELLIAPDLFKKVLEQTRDEPFRDLLTLAWESGARPQELLRLEARHVELDHARLVIPAGEAKGKKRIRIVHLTEGPLAIVRRLVSEYPDGALLRNEDGKPWTRFAVGCRFSRLKERLGVKLCLYTFRHSFCHRALKNGVDPITLANLMGHVDPTMIARVYSHLDQDQPYLKESLRRATR